MKKCMLIITILILASFCAIADPVVLEKVRKYNNGDIEITIEPIKNEITNIESALFKVTIENKKQTSDYVGLLFSEIDNWKWVRTDPIYYGTSETSLDFAKPISFHIIMEPNEDIDSGSHIVKSIFKIRNSGKLIDVPLDVYIKSVKYAKYTPDLKVEIVLNENIDPREDNSVLINIENYNARFYDDEEIEVVIKSNILGEKKSYTGLSAMENEDIPSAVVKIPLFLTAKQSPQRDTITGHLKIGDQIISIAPITYDIIDYTNQFSESIDNQGLFLKNTKTLNYANDGNNAKKQLIQVSTGFFSRFFTSTDPAAKVSRDVDGKRYLEWDVNLAPGETFVANIVVSYRWIFYVALIALFLIIYTYISQSPVYVEKEAYNVESAQGGISEMKVNVVVKNTSPRPIEKIEVIDKVPNIVDVMKEFDVGTLRPSKIIKQSGSTLIKWEIPELDPHEERILSYKIKSKLSILGDFSLPIANVKYKKGKKKVVVYSNSVTVQG